jgi:hypothetical protein
MIPAQAARCPAAPRQSVTSPLAHREFVRVPAICSGPWRGRRCPSGRAWRWLRAIAVPSPYALSRDPRHRDRHAAVAALRCVRRPDADGGCLDAPHSSCGRAQSRTRGGGWQGQGPRRPWRRARHGPDGTVRPVSLRCGIPVRRLDALRPAGSGAQPVSRHCPSDCAPSVVRAARMRAASGRGPA